jgi:hypothetical protein
MNKYIGSFSIIIFISILLIIRHYTKQQNQEPFNTYFRQTVRPQMRNIKDTKELITYHFNNQFKDLRRTLGIY